MPSQEFNRILIVRLSAIGDVSQTLPVLIILKNNYPQAFIGWLVEEDAAPILEGHPMIDKLHISCRKRWLKSLKNPFLWIQTIREAVLFFNDINQQRYQAALDFQGLLKSSLTLFLTGISNRIGYSGAREGASIFYTQKIPFCGKDLFSPDIPIMQHFKALLKTVVADTEALTYPVLSPTDDACKKIDSILNKVSCPIIIFAPSTKWLSKYWPLEHWITLAQAILKHTSASIVLVGGKGDCDFAKKIVSELNYDYCKERILNLTGTTNLIELKALFKRSNIVIGSDSAPLHLAGAVGHAALIGLYGPTSPMRTPPPCDPAKYRLLHSEEKLQCQPCHKKLCSLETTECMRLITPDTVFKTVVSFLSL